MANMCEVAINIRLEGESIEVAKNFVKNVEQYIPPTDDAIILVDDLYLENDILFIYGEVKWSLNKEEAVSLVKYFIEHLRLNIDKTYIEIKYLERGFEIGGMYVLSAGVLKQGDMTEDDWDDLKRFNIEADNVSDSNWDGYWTTLYSHLESVKLIDIYNLNTNNLIKS